MEALIRRIYYLLIHLIYAQSAQNYPSEPPDSYQSTFVSELLTQYIPIHYLTQNIEEHEKSIEVFRDAEKEIIDFNTLSNNIVQDFTNLISSRQLALKNLRNRISNVFDTSILRVNGEDYTEEPKLEEWNYCSAKKEFQVENAEDSRTQKSATEYKILKRDPSDVSQVNVTFENDCVAFADELTTICEKNIEVNYQNSVALRSWGGKKIGSILVEHSALNRSVIFPNPAVIADSRLRKTSRNFKNRKFNARNRLSLC